MTNRILRRRDEEEITGLSRATIYRHVRAGTFPAPFKLTERLVGWLATDVEDWLASRIRG